jgi:hypothetical protein
MVILVADARLLHQLTIFINLSAAGEAQLSEDHQITPTS